LFKLLAVNCNSPIVTAVHSLANNSVALITYTELSAQLDWHIYEAQCKVNAVKSIAELKVLGFMQTGHTAEVSSANFSPDGKQICRQLPAKSQSLRLLSDEAETICLPSGLKFALETSAVCPVCIKPNTLSSAIDFTALTLQP
jgi:hypothetical protein